MNNSSNTSHSMKRENYHELAACLESYEHALECRRMEPDVALYGAAVNVTYDRLMERLRYILWDEAPSDIPRPANPYEDFLLE